MQYARLTCSPVCPIPTVEKREAILELLTRRGFKRVHCDALDDMYANRAYFHKRGVQMPSRSSCSEANLRSGPGIACKH